MVYQVGQMFGNYRLIQFIGGGGFADVYLGKHRYLNSYAALKVLRTSLNNKEAKMFLAEAQTLARLRHPNIVRVLEYAIEDGAPVLVMDYARQGTVRTLYPKGTPVPLETIVLYVRQIAAALQYAHDRNIIHRDVKPENMLLDDDFNLLLSDFGLALLAPSSQQLSTQEMAGTIPYTAPEQLRGKPCFASDQYALGIVTYEWLCGRRPFEGSFWEVINQHQNAEPPLLRDIRPDLPFSLQAIMSQVFAKDPKFRFENIQAFADALEHASHSNTITERKPISTPINNAPLDGSYSRMLSHTTPTFAPPVSSKKTFQTAVAPRLSRRTMIAGLTGLAVAGGIGGLALWERSSQLSAPKSTSVAPLATHPAVPSPSPNIAKPALTSQATIYAGSTDHFLYALNANDGTLRWSYEAGDWVNATPAVANGVVYAGANDHTLYAFNATNGNVAWRYQVGDKIISWPAVSNGIVYFGSWDQNVYAVRTNNGSLLWRYQTGNRVSSPTLVVDGVVYIGSDDNYLYALNAINGVLLWRSITGGNIAALATVADQVVYVGSGDHSLYALQTSSGKQLWHYETGDAIYSAPVVANSIVYFGSFDHYVYALKTNNGSLLWRYQTGDKCASLPTIHNGILYIGSSDGFIYAFRATDGSIIWRYQTGGYVSSKPIVTDDFVYIGGSNGLFALKTSDGSLRWKFAAGGGAVTTPTLLA